MAERDQLAKNDYAYKEFRLGAPPAKMKLSANDDDDTTDDDTALALDEDASSYSKADVHLRETLRILQDAIALGQNRAYWAANHAPVTLAINASPEKSDPVLANP